MSILRRLGETFLGLPPEYTPNPKEAISVTVGYMHSVAQAAGNAWYWSGHRLIQAGTTRLECSEGEWPLISYVEYLDKGEGGDPTVYVYARDVEDGPYCLHPADFLVILPPGGES